MIILPDRNISHPKILMPMKRSFWSPSNYISKDEFGNDTIRYRFIATIRYHDGKIAWRGTFEDRDDFDAFAFAYASGSLRYERELWKLSIPYWTPAPFEDLPILLAVTVILTSTTGTYTIPGDWNSGDNIIHMIGAGGSGAAVFGPAFGMADAGGGGGGGYARQTNYPVDAGTSVSYGAGTGGSGRSAGTSSTATPGIAGGNTFFNGTSYAAAPIGATGGNGGTGTFTSGAVISYAFGGTGKGTVVYAGGFGGYIGQNFVSSNNATGGGGAGGPNGAGNTAVTIVSPSSSAVATTGGTGGNGSGGTAGAASTNGIAPAAAGNGADIATSYGSGGGGGGGVGNFGGAGGTGGFYGGGGGGGAGNGSSSSGAGRQGLIHITYIPYGLRFNMPILGM